MKKVLFIDRDGTLIVEPRDDFQVIRLKNLNLFPEFSGIFISSGNTSILNW